jgi:23S rRNA pseudouridine1911/1915/1917 synthase
MTRLRVSDQADRPERPEGVDPAAVVTVLRVPPEAAGMRIDRFVQSQLKRTSRTKTQAIIFASAYGSDGRRLSPGDRVQAEQRIMLWRAPWDETPPEGELPILFEDPALLAIDKPANIPVHPTARYYRSTVTKMLEAARPGERLFLAHRLDRETTGVLLLSRTSEADRHVKRQFAGIDPRTGRPSPQRFVEKAYLAIARGWPVETSFRIDLPLEEDSANSIRVKMRIAKEGTGMASSTVCSVLGRREHPETGSRYALVRCELETGRQHQIRVHLAALGHPLVGDKLYGDDDRLHARSADGKLTEADLAALELPRQALHAQTLELEHPFEEGRRVRVESPLAGDLRAFWDALEEPVEPTPPDRSAP